MFEKIITNDRIMNVVEWFLSHPDGEYNAMTVGMNTGILSPSEFVLYLVLLDECDIINVNKDLDEKTLRVSLNRYSLITQSLIELRNLLEDELSTNELALSALYRIDMMKAIDDVDVSDLSDMLSEEEKESLIETVKNYQDLDDDDDIANHYIKSRISNLADEGKLEEFIEFIQEL